MRSPTQSHEPGDDAQHQQSAASEVLPSKVTVIVPVRDDAQRLARCLKSVLATNHPLDRLEVIVADNGSTDDTPEVARSLNARVLPCAGMPVAAVRNRAVKVARGDVLAFVDADHEIGSDWIPLALEGLSRPRSGAIGALYSAPPDGTWVQELYDSFRARVHGVHAADWLPSGNLAIHRHAFESIGGFDTALETCEDVDFCQRLKGAGFSLLSDARLRSVHYGDPSTLRALFFGELWRGRDNLRVSLRGPLTLRALPSILIPIAGLALICVAVIGIVTLPIGGLWVVAGAVGGLFLLALLRVVRMLTRVRPIRLVTVIRALAVAWTYEAARSLALVFRTSHRVRHSGPFPPVLSGGGRS
jgi:GT2 family glycosyltransferase